MDTVSRRDLVVGHIGAVAVGDEAEEILRRVPVADGAAHTRAVSAEVRVLDEHRAGGVDRRLPLVPNGATEVDLGAAVDEDRPGHRQNLVGIVPGKLAVDRLARVRASGGEVDDPLVVVLVRELVRVAVAG